MIPTRHLRSLFLLLLAPAFALGQVPAEPPRYIRENFTKREVQIPMRDGVRLFTSIYAPKDTSKKYPILMTRTPYGVSPYGVDSFKKALGPSRHFLSDGYIFVYQDVRGCYMSEGKFVNMTPHRAAKKDKHDIDESTDTYDTIDWLLKNVPNNNGKVGHWGISYPGFYAAAGMIDAHPALKAVSPQAPIADWFWDDFHHHGAFFLPHSFNFFARFGAPRPEPTTKRPTLFEHQSRDGYQFFLDLGSMKNADLKYYKGKVDFWNEMCDHPNYDEFWKVRDLRPHLKKVAPAVMTVGGWFDAEDLFGPLKIYRQIEKENPDIFNVLVMGPWIHGGWSDQTGGNPQGDRVGNIHFGSRTAEHYQKEIELPFFTHYLKDEGNLKLPEASVFETGANRWRQFDAWPPKETEQKTLYLHRGCKLSFEAPAEEGEVFEEFVSDPAKPVPFSEAVTTRMTVEYMTDDQRFAARRPDVLAFQSEPLKEDVTLAGPLMADLRVSTSGTDADWIVKLIDVLPPTAKNPDNKELVRPYSGYQMMVRSEVIRGRFRNSYEKPEPFVSNQPTKVPLELLDVLHTFKKGHRIMIQLQCTWFPLIDRNPQNYIPNIYKADEKDFIKARQRVYCSQKLPTSVQVGILKP
jgi:putative CocE/NonD family hydrolase